MGIFDIFKKKDNKPIEAKTPVYEAENAPQKPVNVWIDKTEEVKLDEDVLKKMKITRSENYHYTKSKRELKEDFYGERVWKHYPYKFQGFRMDGVNVYVKDDNGDEYLIGTVGPDVAEDIVAKQPKKPDIKLFGGKYKDVDDDVEIDEEDPSVYIKYMKLQK